MCNKALVVQWLLVPVLVSCDLWFILQCNKFDPLWWHSFLKALARFSKTKSPATVRFSKTKHPLQLLGFVHLALPALAVL